MEITFDDLYYAIHEVQSRTKHNPIRIKMNKAWMEKEVGKYPIIKENKTINLKSSRVFAGIPVEIDNDIPTYEFVYAEGQY